MGTEVVYRDRMLDFELFSVLSLGQAAWLALWFLLAIGAVVTAIKGHEVPSGDVVQRPYGWKKAAITVVVAVVMALPVLADLLKEPGVAFLDTDLGNTVGPAVLTVIGLSVAGFALMAVVSFLEPLFRPLWRKLKSNTHALEDIEVLLEEVFESAAEWDKLPTQDQRLKMVHSIFEGDAMNISLHPATRAQAQRAENIVTAIQKARAKRAQRTAAR